jgi:hypothetical protein
MGQQKHQLRALTRIGQGEHHIVRGDHPQVPVAGFRGMQKESGSTGAGQGGGNLATDVPRFANARDNHPAGTGQAQPTGRHELRAEPGAQGLHGLRLDRQGAARGAQQRGIFDKSGSSCGGHLEYLRGKNTLNKGPDAVRLTARGWAFATIGAYESRESC